MNLTGSRKAGACADIPLVLEKFTCSPSCLLFIDPAELGTHYRYSKLGIGAKYNVIIACL